MVLTSLTDIGSTRSSNQDNYWATRLRVNEEEQGIICLCDGMGGLSHGELASTMVVKAVRSHLLGGKSFESLDKVISEVNDEIYKLSQGEKAKLMGTTCTCLKCVGDEYKVWHVGDSRAYLLRDGDMKQITTDHSAIKKYGVTRKSDPQLYEKYKNKLTRCVGVKPSLQLDYYEGTVKSGDTFVLCSDGGWRVFEDRVFDATLLGNLRELFDTCIRYGETDNITMSVLTI